MASSRPDIYQARYIRHQRRKGRTIASGTDLLDLLRARRSQRTFFQGPEISEEEMDYIYEAIRLAPSSCNRQAILIKPIMQEMISYLDSLLVGGKNWLRYAQVVLLLFADMLAYKSPAEVEFMPWLDAGFVGENAYLAATCLGLGVCFVNPNIREKDRSRFAEQFNPRGLLFCGAIALGRCAVPDSAAPKRKGIFY